MSADPHKGSSDSIAPSGIPDGRHLASTVVHGIYRLVKGCILHDGANQAVAQVVSGAQSAVQEYCAANDCATVSVLLADKTVFVNRHVLRASRETYALAAELAVLLGQCAVNEVTFSRDTPESSLQEFGRLVALGQREKQAASTLKEVSLAGVSARWMAGFRSGDQEDTPVRRAARTYAASVMIVRSFYADLHAGKYVLPHAIKRIAQKLVSQNEEEARVLVAIAAAPAGVERANLAVSSAILALAMCHGITEDRAALASLASAALLYDAGRPRLVSDGAMSGARIERVLNEDEEDRVPQSTMFALSVLGKLHPPSISRAVIAYEAVGLRNPQQPPYDGRRTPSALGRILAVARRFVELRLPDGNEAGLRIDDALQVLNSQADDATGRTFVKLLTGALGIFPAGTMVELSTGEMAVVLSTPDRAVDFARPPVRLMYDSNAQLMDPPEDVDLARVAPGGVARVIRRTVDASDKQMKQMRAYVESIATQHADAMRAASTRAPPARAPMRNLTVPAKARAPQMPSSYDPPDYRETTSGPDASTVPPPVQSHQARFDELDLALPGSADLGQVDLGQADLGQADLGQAQDQEWQLGAPGPMPAAPVKPPSVAPAATARPRRRDPRMEDDDDASNLPRPERLLRREPIAVTPRPASTAPPAPPVTSLGDPLAVEGMTDTDALLAAYLEGLEESAEPAQTSSSVKVEKPITGGLRWGRSDEPPPSSGRPAAPGETARPPSSDGSQLSRPNTGGLRWGSTPKKKP